MVAVVVWAGGIAALVGTWCFLSAVPSNVGLARPRQVAAFVVLLVITLWFLCAVALTLASIWGGFSLSYAALILIEAAVVVSALLYQGKLCLKELALGLMACLFLGILPLAGGFGSNNPLMIQAQFHMAPWFALMTILNTIISKFLKRPLITALLFLVPICLSQAWFFRQYVLYPFRIPGPCLPRPSVCTESDG